MNGFIQSKLRKRETGNNPPFFFKMKIYEVRDGKHRLNEWYATTETGKPERLYRESYLELRNMYKDMGTPMGLDFKIGKTQRCCFSDTGLF